MRGADFIRKVQKLAKARGALCRFEATRGKGSHGMLYLGNRQTIVPNPSRELKTGTLHAMLKQLGITLDDLR